MPPLAAACGLAVAQLWVLGAVAAAAGAAYDAALVPGALAASASGSVISNRAPCPGSDRTLAVPWWDSMIAATIARPRPVPAVRGAVS